MPLFRTLAGFQQQARRFVSEDEGVVAPLVAICMVVLVGFVAIVTDAGLLYVQRTQLQKAVDAAALAGAYDIGISSNSQSDAALYASYNGVNPAADQHTQIVTNQAATVYANGDAWTAAAQRSVPLGFAAVLGIKTGTVAASATAISSPALSVDWSTLLPYAIWGGNEPVGLGAGATVDYRDNQYKSDNVKPFPDGSDNTNWTSNSNDFKGFLYHGQGTVKVGDSVTDGGNADEGAYMDKICKLAASGTPGIFPVIGHVTGNGQISLYIEGFIAVVPQTINYCSGGGKDMSQAFSGKVFGPATISNGTPGGQPNPNFPTVRVLKLWQ